MKNLIFVLTVLITLLFSACSSKKPKDIAIDFANAMAEQDYVTAKKYATEDTQKTIDLFKGMAGEKKPGNTPKYVVISENINGENAIVKLKNTADGNEENEVHLKKVKGKWLVFIDNPQITNKKDNNELKTN